MKTNDLELIEADIAAARIGVSRRHLIDVLKKEIPYLRKGKRIMFDPKDVRKYIEKEKIREGNPKVEQRISSHKVYSKAMRKGIIVRATNCEKCQSTDNIEGHHHDYNNPLDVTWLCRRCHYSLHKQLKKEAKSHERG